MYPTSAAYKTAIQQNVRDIKITGTITLKDDTVINITDEDIVQGSLYVTEQCVAGEDIEVGNVYASEMGLSLSTPLENPYSLDGARIHIYFGIDVGSLWEYVPLGYFYVTEIQRKANNVNLTALDGMLLFDVEVGDPGSSSPRNFIVHACQRAGVTLGTSIGEIDALPNAGVLLAAPDASKIKTARDLLMWACQITGSFARMNRQGQVEIVPTKAKPSVKTIAKNERFNSDVSDFAVKITKVSMQVGETVYSRGTDGMTMALEENPLMTGLSESQINAVLDNLLAQITTAVYVPFNSNFIGDPALQPGDFVTLADTSVLGGGDVASIITHSTWRYRGPHNIKGAGKHGLVRGVQNQQMKAVSSIVAIARAAQDLALSADQSAQLIKDAIGGHVLIRQAPDETNEILIMDHPDPAQATKIWRWNMGGLGYSDNCVGADNPDREYEIAMTMDGAINANFIKTGQLDAGVVRIGPQTTFAPGYDPSQIEGASAVGMGVDADCVGLWHFDGSLNSHKGVAVETDAFTKLLLHMDGSDNGTTFTDECGNTVTAHGDVVTKTGVKKFGTASGYFDGTDDYLSIPESEDWNFGTNDFTVDLWINPSTVNSDDGIFWFGGNTNLHLALAIYNNRLYRQTAFSSGSFGDNLTAGIWYHIAVVRSGNNLYFFVNGALKQTDDVTGISLGNSVDELYIGYYNSINNCFHGYIDEFRISKGIARWTSNFTPPITPYAKFGTGCFGQALDGYIIVPTTGLSVSQGTIGFRAKNLAASENSAVLVDLPKSDNTQGIIVGISNITGHEGEVYIADSDKVSKIYTETTQADFNSGTLTDVTATSAGDLELVLVPMTNDDPTPAMLSQSGISSFSASLSVDNNTATSAWHTDTSTAGAYIKIDLGAGNEKAYVKARVYVVNAGYAGNYSIQYSDDGTNWNTCATNFTPSSAGWNEKTWGNAGKHRYWRLYLTNTPGSGSWLNEMEWYTDSYYKSSGTREKIVDLTGANPAGGTSISWVKTTPTNTTVKVETALSTDGGVTYGAYQEATSGNSIPGITSATNLSNARLKIKETLSTTDTSVTPKLHSLTFTIWEKQATTAYGPNKSTLTGWDSISLAWKPERLSLVANDTEACYIENPSLPASLGSHIFIGTDRNGNNAINTLIDELRIDKVYKEVNIRTGWHKTGVPFYTSEDMKQWPGYVKAETDGIKIYDSEGNVRVVLGSWLVDLLREYGIKIIKGKIYSTLIRSGEEGSTTYIELNPTGNFRIVNNGITILETMTDVIHGGSMYFSRNNGDAFGLLSYYADTYPGFALEGKTGGSSGPLTLRGSTVKVLGDFEVAVGSKFCIQETNYGRLGIHARESPEIRFVDEGMGTLVNGECRIDVDPIFLECIEPHTPDSRWYVNLTPYGKAILYVDEIGDGYFVVKDYNGNANGIEFTWSLSATRKDYALIRFMEVLD